MTQLAAAFRDELAALAARDWPLADPRTRLGACDLCGRGGLVVRVRAAVEVVTVDAGGAEDVVVGEADVDVCRRCHDRAAETPPPGG